MEASNDVASSILVSLSMFFVACGGGISEGNYFL